MSSAPDVSVVVPTRDRPAPLARCLAALVGQSERGSLEVLVVDDGSVDADSVRSVVNARPGVRLVRLDGAGPAAARNLGAREARGAVVCFTDDDCVPLAGWAAGLAGALAEGVDAVGGSTRSGVPGDPFGEATEIITSYLQRRGRPPEVVFVPSNNLACRRELVLELPFDEAFPTASGEDRDWCARLLRSGRRLAVEPAAVVLHFPATGIRGFWRQHVRYGHGAHRLARDRSAGAGLQGPIFYLGLIRAGFSGGLRCGLLVVVAQIATAVGFVQAARARRAG